MRFKQFQVLATLEVEIKIKFILIFLIPFLKTTV